MNKYIYISAKFLPNALKTLPFFCTFFEKLHACPYFLQSVLYIYVCIYRIIEKSYNNLFATLSFMYFTIFRHMSDAITNIPT